MRLEKIFIVEKQKKPRCFVPGLAKLFF